MENIHLNYVAIIIATIANFVLGFIWYTPLFGKAWGKGMGFNMDQKPPAGALVKGMVFMVIGNFLMAFVFAHNISAWNIVATTGTMVMSKTMNIMNAAVFTWLGFFLPVDLGTV